MTLLLELPARLQRPVDAWVRTGASAEVEAAVREGRALPLGALLSWAHRHLDRVTRVVAMDEDRATTVLNRALLRDTRNARMAGAVLAALAASPGDLVVAYGGQLHMTLAGRYRYDLENRTPAGALLLREGVERTRIRTVLLSGAGRSAAADVLPPGVYEVGGALGGAAYGYFIRYPIFRAEKAGELFDYFVNLGALTGADG